ncbi:MAG: sulfate ABC transporter permease subunit CysT [Methylomonas sp.]|nr:sulfate ABC transporter permease subunit CysT [Methylomonas sp.]PPD20734.1 MAG: sulfate ABC transporter permease subunit CysT [Methylomonas sp.]PPD26231.1 MAG: sulfate ABC transporter permease subunit CysT [Methylomonas sp.]PPD37950.1 MAG: sulfate ABC transporter permease subunit CysT [Methylomonas sp.]PPD54636.1 MAG: sulfate ABC transporter permease subunit CysT [Methylomonas sp.]
MPQSNIMPGFRPTMGFTLFYLALIVLIPLSAMLLKTLRLSWEQFVAVLTHARVIASFKISFGTALLAATIAAVLGFIIAWTLVRYPFPGKKLFDALIDLPFALPTAVAGIVLATLYEPRGWIGKVVMEVTGVQIAYKPLGIVVALIFIGLPFVVRTVEPVLQELDTAMEEAAASLGASRWQTFLKVILPNLLPATITGFALAFARGVGEYGSVIFIAGNMPYVSEVVPLLIITKLEQYDYTGATAIGLAMLIVSFLLLLLINSLQSWLRRRGGQL